MPKYTYEQIHRAKNIDVRTFLEQTEGYTFEGHGRFLKCQNPERTNQPSSLSIDTNLNRIFYNSVTGNRPLSAVDWCTMVKDMDFQTSMQLVLGENPQGERMEIPRFQQHTAQQKTGNEPKNLELPEKSDTMIHAKAYLTKTRCIPENIINDCISKNLIYEDIRRNAVFVGYGSDNKTPKYAARRGTFTPDGKEPFKRDCTGSDKNFAFRLEGKNTETVYVAEAAIDVLSLAALEDKFHGSGAYKEKTYLSTGGAGIDNALEQFCKTHDVKTINICFDNDEAGKNGMEKIMQKFRERGYTVNDMRASMAHDYNDELVAWSNDPDFFSKPPDVVLTPAQIKKERSDIMPEKTNEYISVQPEHSANTDKSENTGLFSVEQNGERQYFTTDKSANELLKLSANSEKPFTQMREYGKPISEKDYTEIQQSSRFKFSVDMNYDNNSAKLFAVNMGRGGVPEKERNRNNTYFKSVKLESFARKEPEKTVSDVQKQAHQQTHETEKADVSQVKQSVTVPEINTEKKSEQTVFHEDMPPVNNKEKTNALISSLKDRQERKRANLLDKIESIDNKIKDRKERINKLNNKISDIETSLKTAAALKRVFGNTAVGKLIDTNIEKKKSQIEKIRNTKIPKQEEKIKAQTDKKTKTTGKLEKVNRKINTLEKIQDFFSALGSKNKEERHKGFVTGLENLADRQREILENKLSKNQSKLDMLSARFSSPELSNMDRLNISGEMRKLKSKSAEFSDKIKDIDKLNSDLENIKNGRFSETEIETAVNRTADKISERLESTEINPEDKGIAKYILSQTVESGREAVSEIAAEKSEIQAEKAKPELVQERVPEEREPEVTGDTEQKILIAVAAVTGISSSELNRLPVEVKADVIAEFRENNGNMSSEQLTERICNITDLKPPDSANPTEQAFSARADRQEKSKQEKQPSVDFTKPLFSRSAIMSEKYKPTSSKSAEDIERDRQKRTMDNTL